MRSVEQQIIEQHLNKYDGGWYNIIVRYTDGIRIEWGRGNRSWQKFLKIRESD